LAYLSIEGVNGGNCKDFSLKEKSRSGQIRETKGKDYLGGRLLKGYTTSLIDESLEGKTRGVHQRSQKNENLKEVNAETENTTRVNNIELGSFR